MHIDVDGTARYTVAEAAKMLRVTPGRVRQLIRDGTFSSIKIGNSNLIPAEAVEKYKTTRRPAGRARSERGVKS